MKITVLAVFLLELIASVILAQETAADVRAELPTCKNPKGTIGEAKISGCKQLVCMRKKNRAYWAESFASSVCCSYQNVGYKISATIATSVGKDNCTEVTLKCGGKEGDPKIEIHIDNEECAHNFCQESFDDLAGRFNLVKAALDKVVNSTDLLVSESNKATCGSNISTTPSTSRTTTETTPTSGQTTGLSEETASQCPTYNCENCMSSSTSPTLSSDAPGSELLFLDFDILSLPSLSPTNCTVPTKNSPTKNTEGYVATVIADGIMICGGKLYDGGWQGSTNKCFLLTNDGFWLSSPPIASMLTVRERAAAVKFDGGWWVIGGYNGSDAVTTSEMFFEHNKTWVPSPVEYPVPVQGHCMVKINETHIFSSGGYGFYHDFDWSSAKTYIYSKATGFVEQEGMKKRRYKHACTLFEDKIYVASGSGSGAGASVEYFSLASQTWESSPSLVPSLPSGVERGLLMVLDGSLNFVSSYRTKKILKLEEIVWSSYTRYEWQEVGEHKMMGRNLKPLRWNVTDCENWNS